MGEHKLSKLNEWGKEKPPGLVIMGQELAISTEDCFEYLKWFKAGERIEGLLCVPNVKEWLELYRNHRKVLRVVIERFKAFGGIAGEGAELAEIMFFGFRNMKKFMERLTKEWKKMRPYEQRRLMSKAQKQVNRIRNLHEADMKSDFEGKMDEDLKRKLLEALKEPEIAFFFRVWIPCWLLYGYYPGKIFKRARFNKAGALEKLLRLDPSVVSEARIAQYLHEARIKGKKATFELLAEALKRGPRAKVTLKKVMYRIAGLISLISIILRHRLTEREIYELFNAAGEDMESENLLNCLPQSPEGFSKALQRERAFWMPTLRPDKK